MSTARTYTLEYEDGQAADYAAKKTAVKHGDASGLPYRVLSPAGKVVAESNFKSKDPEPVVGITKEEKVLETFTVTRNYPGNYAITMAPFAVALAEAWGLEATIRMTDRLNRLVDITGLDKADVIEFTKVLDQAVLDAYDDLHAWQKKHIEERRGLTDMQKYNQHRDRLAKFGASVARRIKKEHAA
jgi:hypothetical protein